MKIAIQCADLDAGRIDGTRVYIYEVLRRLGCVGVVVGDRISGVEKDSSIDCGGSELTSVNCEHEFWLYHRGEFNSELTPPICANYKVRKLGWGLWRWRLPMWTQVRFAWELWWTRPDVLWMPMHALPFWLPSDIKTVVTIHDLAFKIFPEHFTWRDRLAQNILTDSAVRRADKIIAVSEATARDIRRFYPDIDESKIVVVYHGFSGERFAQNYPLVQTKEVLRKLHCHSELVSESQAKKERYILYIGALQPRKNLVRLIEAFEQIAQDDTEVKLVLVGGVGWLADDILAAARNSVVASRIILTGRLPFDEVAILMQNARVMAFVSLYEGFGLPILEAFAAGVPVVAARNSSLPEIAGDGAVWCDAQNVESIAAALRSAITDEDLRKAKIANGKKQLARFGWNKCARQTREVLSSTH